MIRLNVALISLTSTFEFVNSFKIGRKEVIGTIFGVGSLRFYGTGSPPSNEETVVTSSYQQLLPIDVRDRVYDISFYFGLSIVITAASAALSSTKLLLLIALVRSSYLGILITVVGTVLLASQVEYRPGHAGYKNIAWILYSAFVGVQIAPLSRIIANEILLKASFYTVGIVGSLSAVVVCAPSDVFLKIDTPLVVGLGLISIWTLGSLYIRTITVLGGALLAVSALVDLFIFCGFTLYTTQKIIRSPEEDTHPSSVLSDPFKEAIYFHLYTINIFLSVVTILLLRGVY